MMVKNGHVIKEVKLEKDGNWGPQYVYVIRELNYILGVECNLEEYQC